ncbi:DUF7679 family protein [Secundilactobacillus paracollinoides]|uniref:DUF7679 family protein n=2 Tax=Secundilactobacillus paracollinoides TaxID=240427 RepID=UPI0006D13FE8|nr:hypothetical protein [Secundilactobacillus paracollinoides]KRL76037.1 hypothetical protein FC17_GL002084 [Secundilactobacillus paracollinoides DSM 15502 = JCM 11969]
MTEQLWCAKIERTDGQTIAYRLSGDLQHALDIDVAGQRHLLHGLIVIPLAPYIFAKPMGTKDDVLPPYGVGFVTQIYQQARDEAIVLMPTRSQFIDHVYWPKDTRENVRTYLQHDYAWLNKKQIDADIDYWQQRENKQQCRPNPFWHVVSDYRIQRHLRRIKAYRRHHE